LLSPTYVGILRICLHSSASVRIVSSSRGGACPTGLRVYPLRGTPHVYYILHKNLKFSVHIQLKAVRHKVY